MCTSFAYGMLKGRNKQKKEIIKKQFDAIVASKKKMMMTKKTKSEACQT